MMNRIAEFVEQGFLKLQHRDKWYGNVIELMKLSSKIILNVKSRPVIIYETNLKQFN